MYNCLRRLIYNNSSIYILEQQPTLVSRLVTSTPFQPSPAYIPAICSFPHGAGRILTSTTTYGTGRLALSNHLLLPLVD
jgi:hypothetical protein